MVQQESEMDNRFRRLLEQNNVPNRAETAARLKRQGRRIIGTVDSSFPEEVIYAAGMIPWRITGTWQENVALAHAHRSVDTDDYSNHIFQSLLEGQLDFLDGLVISCEYDDIRRLRDNWDCVGKTPFTYLLYIPCKDTEITRRAFTEAITDFTSELERFFQVKVSKSALGNAIQVYNKWRSLLMSVYELRKKEVPPISGSEALKLVTASFVMPKDEFNQELEALLPYLEKRKALAKHLWPRLLISGDKLDNPAYLELIENTGSLIAMDDLDTGSRYIWGLTSLDKAPLTALVERYISRPPSPLVAEWSKYVEQAIAWTREYNITGVLNLPHMHALSRQMVTPYFRDRIAGAGIPMMSFKIDYHLANTEQLKTRIGAFIELLHSQGKG